MEGLIQLSASVVSRTGVLYTGNEDSFYLNGKFSPDRKSDRVQASIENDGNEFLFSVSEAMEYEPSDDSKSEVSIYNELKKFHDRIRPHNNSIKEKTDMLFRFASDNSNLIRSLLSGAGDETPVKTAFAGLLINKSRAAVVNNGDAHVYLLRGGNMMQMTPDAKKAERLMKMGIISSEQAKIYENRMNPAAGEVKTETRKSDEVALKKDDTILLCTRGISDNIEDIRISSLLSLIENTDIIAERLVNEAVKNGAEENITAMVIRLNNVDEQAEKSEKVEKVFAASARDKETDRKREIDRKRETERYEKDGDENANDGEADDNDKKDADDIDGDDEDAKDAQSGKVISRIATVRQRIYDEDGEEYMTTEKSGIKRVISAAIICIGIGIMIFAAYKLWDSSTKSANNTTTTATTAVSSTSTSGTSVSQASESSSGGTEGQTGEGQTTNVSQSTAAVTATQEGDIKYVVKKGDTLMSISKKFYNNVDEYKTIMKANNITNADKIIIGQVLIIPKPTQ